MPESFSLIHFPPFFPNLYQHRICNVVRVSSLSLGSFLKQFLIYEQSSLGLTVAVSKTG